MQSKTVAYINATYGCPRVHTGRHALVSGNQKLRIGTSRLAHSVDLHLTCRPNLRTAVALGDTEPSTSGRDSDDDITAQNLEYLQHCQATYTLNDTVTISATQDLNPIVTLRHPSGSSADIHLHGGVVSSWRRPDGKELLHTRTDRGLFTQGPVRGGIELAWPQYGAGVLPTHGLLKDLHWSIVETAATDDPEDPKPTVILYASSDVDTEDEWPYSFQALYAVTLMSENVPINQKEHAQEFDRAHTELWEQALLERLPKSKVEEAMAAAEATAELQQTAEEAVSGISSSSSYRPRAGSNTSSTGSSKKMEIGVLDYSHIDASSDSDSEDSNLPAVSLKITLQIQNCSDRDMPFTGGIRQHWATEDVSLHSKFVKVLGLGGKYVLDYGKDSLRPRMGIETEDFVFFSEPKDTVRCYVDSGTEGQVKFCPGDRSHVELKSLKGFSDIAVEHPGGSDPVEAQKYVGLVNARKAVPVKLAPDETWTAEVVLTQRSQYWELPLFEKENPETIPLPPREEALPPKRGGSGDPSDISEMLE